MESPRTTPDPTRGAGRLRELAALFLQLGATSFGGPAAHIAIMEHELVRRRGWLTREQFLDLIAATHLIPGPNSTELAIHIGHRRAGWPGLVVAGACFILPAVILTALAAWAYVRWGALPVAGDVLYGIEPVVIAIVLQALLSLGRTALRGPGLVLLAAAVAIAAYAGVNELLLLLAAGGAAIVRARGAARARLRTIVPLALAPAGAATAMGGVALLPLFLSFLKTGAVLFGSGYVLLAFLRADLVVRHHWLTESQLLDAIAIGQITPGPVFSTATFIGYVLAGTRGAAVATAGIFLPAFVFVAASGPLVPRLRASRTAGAFLDGVVAASLGLMAVVTWQLGRAALGDPLRIGLAIAAVTALLRLRVGSLWLVLAGALAGLLRHLGH